jgi:small subunit ribosomal protein S3
MGQKVNPKGFRIGPVYSWDSRWFASQKQYKVFVLEDARVRTMLMKKLQPAGIVRTEIERSINKITITLHVVRPGMVIGRGGAGMEDLKNQVQKYILGLRKKTGSFDPKSNLKLDIRVEPVKDPYLSSYFVATQIAEQLAKRLPHKRVVNFAIDKVMGSRAKGVKVILSGRIGGAEISRRETYKHGSIPLSTIRELVDFSIVPSLTKSGYIGVKVWICRNPS